jgi:flagellar motility protein MotE (MotC chaperone)
MPSKTDAKKDGKKKKSKLFTIFMILLDIVIIAVAFGAVFYFIFYNNIGGVTEKYYSTVKNIPLLNLALPEAPDPLNPKYMTQREIRDKYLEYKEENEQLKKQLEEAGRKTEELQVFKDDYDKLANEAQILLQSLKTGGAAITQREKQLAEQKDKLDEAIANSDREAFREYFETIDPENAAMLYEAIVKQQQTDENVKKFAQVYAEMDPASAATIFEQLGTSKLDMIAETLKAMNKAASSEILAAMTPDFAAKVTEKLNTLYKGD